MARDLDLDELLDAFTLPADELKLLRNKSGATRLGFAVTLRFLLWRGRFPRGRGEVPDNAIAHGRDRALVGPPARTRGEPVRHTACRAPLVVLRHLDLAV